MKKQKKSGKTKPNKSRGKKSKMKFNMGIMIDIPPELDLPAGAPFEGQDQPATMRSPKEIDELFGPLVDMATNAWRLKSRMVDSNSGEPIEETRKLYRFVERMFRALDDAGIQVIDKLGKPYNQGMTEQVINFEQTPGLLAEEIIETIRPSIRWKERTLYRGEIIVGIPLIETSPKETPEMETDTTSAETTDSENTDSEKHLEQAQGDLAKDESLSTETQDQDPLADPQTPEESLTNEKENKEPL
ncbi:hypothetical protein N9Z53_00115 [Mariniblastus sp.]|nr:hypothetical protein [Mariniblastus sp.]